MMASRIRIALLVGFVLAVGMLAGHLLSSRVHPDVATDMHEGDASERQPLYWYDPMVPTQHFDRPGKSPFMDMQLVPKYADEEQGADAAVRIAPGVQQNLGVRLAAVKRASFSRRIEGSGIVQSDERQVAAVQTRVGGFVLNIHGRAPGEVLQAGASLVTLQVPVWTAAQAEFIALARSGDAALIDAARERLRLLGMPAGLIARIERTRLPESEYTIIAPRAGAIETFEVRPGMTLEIGDPVARIVGLERLWVEVPLPAGAEDIAVPDNEAVVTVAGIAQSLPGRVIALLPLASAETRSAAARVEVANTGLRLRPGMFAQVQFQQREAEPALLVPAEAVIRRGAQDLVLVAEEGGFRPVQIETGVESGGRIQVLSGLTEGQQIVASAQFLIDSEANLQGVLARMQAAAPGGAPASAAMAEQAARGKLVSVDGSRWTISHEPVPTLQWPAMTMPFQAEGALGTASVAVGDSIRFWFTQDDDGYRIQRVEKAAAP